MIQGGGRPIRKKKSSKFQRRIAPSQSHQGAD